MLFKCRKCAVKCSCHAQLSIYVRPAIKESRAGGTRTFRAHEATCPEALHTNYMIFFQKKKNKNRHGFTPATMEYLRNLIDGYVAHTDRRNPRPHTHQSASEDILAANHVQHSPLRTSNFFNGCFNNCEIYIPLY